MEKGIERFLDFVKEKGGASVVAKRVGKHPQFIYNIEQGKGKPNFETLSAMKEAYPDLDLNWIFTGIGNSNERIKELETRLEVSESLILRAMGKKHEASKLLPVDNLLGMVLSTTLGRPL